MGKWVGLLAFFGLLPIHSSSQRLQLLTLGWDSSALTQDNKPPAELESNKGTKGSREVPFEDPWNDLSTPCTPDLQLNPNRSYGGDDNGPPTKLRGLDPLSEDHQANDDYHSATLPSLESEKDLPPLPARDQAEVAPTLPPRRDEPLEVGL